MTWPSRLGLTALLLTTGCGSQLLGYTDDEVSGKFDIRTWWSSQSESRAFDKLRTRFTTRYPGVEVLQSTRSPDEQRESLWQDIKQDPPDTFPCLLGAGGVERFVRYDGAELADSPFVALDELSAAGAWRDKISPHVVGGLEVDGSLYALPVDVHRINTVLYNVELFARHELTPPHTLPEFYEVCRVLEAAGIAAVAGAADGWTISALVFDSIMPAVSTDGVRSTRRFLRGESERPEADPGFLAALAEAVQLLEHVDIAPGDDWSRAVARVGNGEAAMVFMGDWARGELESRDARYGESFGVFPSPGTADVFVFNSDAFPLVKDSKHPEIARAWLDFIMDARNQVPFNHIKGGIPALKLTPEQLDPADRYGRETLAQFNDAEIEKVGALSTLVSAEFEAALNPVMQQFATDRDSEPVVRFFRDNYGLLR